MSTVRMLGVPRDDLEAALEGGAVHVLDALVRAGVDVAVGAGLVAELADVELEDLDLGRAQGPVTERGDGFAERREGERPATSLPLKTLSWNIVSARSEPRAERDLVRCLMAIWGDLLVFGRKRRLIIV